MKEINAINSPRAPKGSNKFFKADVDGAMYYLMHGTAKSEPVEDVSSVLMSYSRQVLIQVMKSCKVKGWYRINDKQTMVSEIISTVIA